MTRIPPKVVSILCVLQVLAIIFGYTLTRSAYKFYPAVVEMLGGYAPPLAWSTKLMIAMGPWLLVLPLAWGVVATLTASIEGGIPELSRRQTLLGYALSAGMALFCYLSVVQMWDSLTRMG
jgi:hypothetical protein